MARDVVRENVRKWRDELINLARSNRLLYFRHTKTSTLEIEEPGPKEIVERLGPPGKSGWQFYIPPEPPENEDEPPPEKPRRWNELLTTKSDPKAIGGALRNLERRSTQEFMDKGLWILYLGIGMLEWLDPADEETAESPLLLIPVKLHRESPRDPYALHLADDDPIINPALSVKLTNDFGVELPILEDVDEIDTELVLRAVEDRLIKKPDWRVTRRSILGCFSFYKEVMYRDLIDNEEAICAHEMVRALALGAKAEIDLDFEPVPEDRLDDFVPPEESVAILDADASQRQCIAAATNGHSFVMDGPPGTGKSQTISNIISELLYRGKTVLFVSEKAAALDVVHKRLAAAGLGEYLLELHSHKATRKEVAQELGRALSAHPRPKAGLSDTDVSKLVARRKELSGYAKALNEQRQPLGRSLHQVIGRISQLQKLPQAPVASSITVDLKPEELAELLETASALARAWGPVERGDSFYWRDLIQPEATAARKRELLDQAGAALRSLEELDKATSAASSETGLGWRTTFGDSERLLKILEHLADRVAVPTAWFTVPDFEAIEVRADELAELVSRFELASSQLAATVGEAWRSVIPLGKQKVDSATAKLVSANPSFPVGSESRAADLAALAEFLSGSEAILQAVSQQVPKVTEAFGLKETGPSLDRIREIANLGLSSGARNLPEPNWFNPSLLGSIEEAANVLGAIVGQYREKQSRLREVFNESVLNLDLESLVIRFETVHRGLGKLRSIYRMDKKALKASTRTGKVNRQVISSLRTALEWQELKKRLSTAEQVHSDFLGSYYYRGVDSDFGAVTAAIEIVREALEVAGEQLKPEKMKQQLARGGQADPALLATASEVERSISAWIRDATTLLPDRIDSLVRLPVSELIEWCTGAAPEAEPDNDSETLPFRY